MIRSWPLLLICLATPVLAQDVRQADANDCAVFGAVLAGKSYEMFSNAYASDCGWRGMGIDVKVEPRPEGQYYGGVKTFLTPPSYSDNGLQASFDEYFDGNAGPASYFKAGYSCTAEKRGRQWHSTGCRMKYIT